jgi:hypothetical protein
MIVTQLDRITAYRIHTPKWASMPLSGAGAATPRWPGVEALYLALDVQTAIDEYKQVSTLLPPGTFVTYQISAAPIVDFREEFNAREWDPLWGIPIAIGARCGLTIKLNRPVGCSAIWCSVPGRKVFFSIHA